MPKTFELPKKIPTHNGEIGQIELRDPNGDDFFDIDPPYRVLVAADEDDNTVEIKRDRVATKRWIMRLSGLKADVLGAVPPVVLNSMYEWISAAVRSTDEKNSDSQ